MKISAAEKLRRFYAQFSGSDHVLILINADPDAIASAMAVKRLLWRKVSGVAISNVNVIKRPDNLAMIRLLDVKLTFIEDLAEPNRFSRFVLVDSQPNHNELFSGFKFHVIIDHHPKTEADAPFMDIRPEYGANSSILTEYIRSAKIKPSAKLATGLFHAIKTDTRNFERKTLIEDVRAFQFLFKHANTTLARKIEQADLRIDFLKYFKIAIDTMRMHRGRIFVNLGTVINPDVCVLIGDFFMRVNPVTWTIVAGIYNNTLILIFRNDGLRKSAGKLAKKSFCQLGSAGGHQSMARAEIPLGAIRDLVDITDEKRLLQWIIDRVEGKHITTQSCGRNDDAENGREDASQIKGGKP
jgi:nanoRNase/pAp phosphatase (c-di-AMP/oligoRNAs hydrolase)